MSRRPGLTAIPIALVHHANQYVVGDGYEDREGISTIVEGYASLLHLHERYGVHANLHLSGTLLEAIAWHRPQFLVTVRRLISRGLVSLIGGTYAENVMTLFPPWYNSRQLDEALWLYRRHLRYPPAEVTVCWIPERVWDSEKLAPVLTSPALANGGYRFVLLDDRLLYPTNGCYQGSPRALFDSTCSFLSAYAGVDGPSATALQSVDTMGLPDACRIYGIDGARHLIVVPISANLRYWVPPRSAAHWQRLEEMVRLLAEKGGDDTLLVYADDMERTAGVGGWDARALERYDHFLQWAASRSDLVAVNLSDWLARNPPRARRPIEAGAFFELARSWLGSEDYGQWWRSVEWAPYRRYFEAAFDSLETCRRAGSDGRLLALARKHLLASGYETAWHEAGEQGCIPSPWARAIASHARACLVIADASRWFSRAERPPSVEVSDLDQDGEDEVVLRGERLYAVLSPLRGGRLTYLFALARDGAVLLIGNPTDDWNLQEELNKFMDRPANHPGALADVGHEHDLYRVSAVGQDARAAFVEMANVQEGSGLLGTRKSVFLVTNAPALVARYALAGGQSELAVEACLSPDYYWLLREGRSRIKAYNGVSRRGFRNRDVAAWLWLPPDAGAAWAEPAPAEPGHGLNVRVEARAVHFRFLIGTGEADEEGCLQILRLARCDERYMQVHTESAMAGLSHGRSGAAAGPAVPAAPSAASPH